MRIARIAFVVAALASSAAWGQATLLQGGPWVPGHAPMYGPGGSSQPVAIDSGAAKGGALGVGLGELGITARGTGTPPFVSQGTGPYGTNVCDYDAPTNNPTGYHYLCFSANASGGLLAYGAGGIASPLPLQFIVNGITYPFPFSGGGSTNLIVTAFQTGTTGSANYGLNYLNLGVSPTTFTFALPSIPVKGATIIIKDDGRQAGVYPITILGNGHNIDGSSSYVMNVPGQSLMLIYNGTQFDII